MKFWWRPIAKVEDEAVPALEALQVALVARTVHDPTPKIRWMAVRHLANYGGPLVDKALEQLANDSDPEIQDFARMILHVRSSL